MMGVVDKEGAIAKCLFFGIKGEWHRCLVVKQEHEIYCNVYWACKSTKASKVLHGSALALIHFAQLAAEV